MGGSISSGLENCGIGVWTTVDSLRLQKSEETGNSDGPDGPAVLEAISHVRDSEGDLTQAR